MAAALDRVHFPKQVYPDTTGNLDYTAPPFNGYVEGSLQELVTTAGAVADVTLTQKLPPYVVCTHYGVAMVTSPGSDPFAGTGISLGVSGTTAAISPEILEADLNVAGEMVFGACTAATADLGMDGNEVTVLVTGVGGNIDTGVTFIVKIWFRQFAPFNLS